MTYVPARWPTKPPYERMDTRNHMFTFRQMAAHEEARKGKQRNYPRGRAPREVELHSWPLPEVKHKHCNKAEFDRYVIGVTARLIQGATDYYVNGFHPVYWRTISVTFLASFGFTVNEFRTAVEVAGNNTTRPFKHYVDVKIKEHPNNDDRLVIHLRIEKRQ